MKLYENLLGYEKATSDIVMVPFFCTTVYRLQYIVDYLFKANKLVFDS